MHMQVPEVHSLCPADLLLDMRQSPLPEETPQESTTPSRSQAPRLENPRGSLLTAPTPLCSWGFWPPEHCDDLGGAFSEMAESRVCAAGIKVG